MRAYVVIPCHREVDLPLIVKCVGRQRYRDLRLVVVENGPAVGACKRLGIQADYVTTSMPHVSHARNAGIEVVRDLGGGFISMWNADDWYGDLYVREQVEHSHRATVVGKVAHFAFFEQRGLFLFQREQAWKPTRRLFGPTLGFNSSDAPEFPVVDEAEEYGFCDAVLERGGNLLSLSEDHFCYIRNASGHTWEADHDEAFRILAAMDDVLFLGPMADPGIIEGRRVSKRVERMENPMRGGIVMYDVPPMVPLSVLPGTGNTEHIEPTVQLPFPVL